MSGGYANRVIRLDFPDLSEDPEKDPIWVLIRNPKLLPPAELASFASNSGYEQEQGEDGAVKVKVADPAAAQESLRRIVARLVVAARAYDGTAVGEYDPETGDPVGEQPRMPPTPWTPEIAANLPLQIIERISEEFAEAVNPQKPASPGTQKTSSSPPSPSSTEPGPVAQPLPS